MNHLVKHMLHKLTLGRRCSDFPMLVCSTHALWAAVTAGTRLGLLQLDCVLLGVMRILRAGFFKYEATSAAQHALACLQVTHTSARHQQKLRCCMFVDSGA